MEKMEKKKRRVKNGKNLSLNSSRNAENLNPLPKWSEKDLKFVVKRFLIKNPYSNITSLNIVPHFRDLKINFDDTFFFYLCRRMFKAFIWGFKMCKKNINTSSRLEKILWKIFWLVNILILIVLTLCEKSFKRNFWIFQQLQSVFIFESLPISTFK